MKKPRAPKARGRTLADASDTVFSLPSAPVLKRRLGGQWPPCPPPSFGGLMTKMAIFLFGFLVLTIGIGLLATISPV
ncbi:hypothetical protein [Pseudomonas sp. CFBP13509]|uniref:hypothetical protein n=1 Tax=Pseudomonas sp. CFBP13509 TaxID=2184008 RepID=UPI0010C142E2|nr:hypothetical protein [Pseudomonas sp. CFBP13509]